MFSPQPEKTREVEALMTQLAISASTALFEAYDLAVAPAVEIRLGDEDNIAFMAMTKFVGSRLQGTLVLGASAGPLRSSNRVGSNERDWIAELANQLMGRLKNKLLRIGVEVFGVQPSVVSGQNLAPVFNRPNFKPLLFSGPDRGLICVWIEVEAAADLSLEAPNDETGIPTEGEVILFDAPAPTRSPRKEMTR